MGALFSSEPTVAKLEVHRRFATKLWKLANHLIIANFITREVAWSTKTIVVDLVNECIGRVAFSKFLERDPCKYTKEVGFKYYSHILGYPVTHHAQALPDRVL